MKRTFLFILIMLFFSTVAQAQVPTLIMPDQLNIQANGLRSLAFVVSQADVSPEVEKSLRYYLTGGPADNSATFDDQSKLFFWRPQAEQIGTYNFTLSVRDPIGQESKRSITINVLATPSPEALPKRWDDFKPPEKYLRGRDYLPTTNIWAAEISALTDYSIAIKVRDAANQLYTLTYLPQEGGELIDKNQRTATIAFGAQYRSENPQLIRRDLYEDLFNYLEAIFKCVESIEVRGGYRLISFTLADQPALWQAVRTDNLSLPKLNISFDDRYYEETLFSQKEPMMIADTPVVKINFNASTGLLWRRAHLLIDKTDYRAAWNEFSTIVIKPNTKVSPFDVEYTMYMLTIPAAKKLPFGEHRLTFTMEDAYGQLISREVFARVVTVPTQLQGVPVAFPNPFNPNQGKEVKIQYRLNQQSNIELVIFSGDGGAITKKRFASGEEGGQKGLNTVAWNGCSDSGLSVSNGIYIGVIIDKDENRILDKFRLTVFR